MKTKRSIPICLLMVVFCLATGLGLSGCSLPGGQKSAAGDEGPFYTDRVVTVRIVTSDANWQTTLKNAALEEYFKADLWFDGEQVRDVAVRPKGNSSLMSVAKSGSARMSLKVDINFFNDARNLNGVKKLNFNNGFADPSLIREALAYDLFEEMGVPVPRFSFVDLWVNDNHLGVYTMVEQVDKAFIVRNFSNSNGNLYKPESPGGTLNWTEADLMAAAVQTDPQPAVDEIKMGGGRLSEISEALGMDELYSPAPTPTSSQVLPAGPGGDMPGGRMNLRGMSGPPDFLSSMGLKTNENSGSNEALLRFLEVLNKEPNESFQNAIEKVLDVDETLKFLAVSAVLVHLDNYIGQFAHNYYLYADDGKFSIIPWDLNMSFGGFANGMDRQKVIDFYIDEPISGVPSERPLAARLLAVPEYLERYHGYLHELINGSFSSESMNTKIDSLAALIRPFVEADTLKFYSTADFETALSEDVGSSSRVPGMGNNYGLKAFVAERTESIAAQLAGTLASRSIDGTGNGGGRGMGGAPGNQGERVVPGDAWKQRNERPAFQPGQMRP